MKLLTTKHGINGELTIPADKSISHRSIMSVSYTHLRAHETDSYLVCRLLLEKKKKNQTHKKKKNTSKDKI